MLNEACYEKIAGRTARPALSRNNPFSKKGWFRDEQEILIEALRRYIDAHRPELMEQFIREDVKWGLHGDE